MSYKCPHGCDPKDFQFHDCITEPGAVPDEGSVGMCYECGGWWELKNGEYVQYTPTKEETEFAFSQLQESRSRFKAAFAERNARRL